jgi:hypothetical protein
MKPENISSPKASAGRRTRSPMGIPRIPIEWMDPMSWRLPSGKALAEFALQAGFLAPLMLDRPMLDTQMLDTQMLGTPAFKRRRAAMSSAVPPADPGLVPEAREARQAREAQQAREVQQAREAPEHTATFRETR